MPLRVAVIASGRGSNFQALIDRKEAGELPVEFVLLLVNKEDAGAIQRAEKYGIPWAYVDHCGKSREEFEQEMISTLDAHNPELVVLAGFMRILTPLFINHYMNRMINIHPALLPSFPGTHGQRDALEYGVKVTGCTVHFVNLDVDGGPIILQRTVPVQEGDDETSLSARILTEEHKALPDAVRLFAEGRLKVDKRVVRIVT